MIDALFLAAYLALPSFAWLRSRSIAWTVICLAASVSIAGVLVNLAIDLGHGWTRVQLQVALLLAVGVVAGLSWRRPAIPGAGRRRQFLAVLVPVLVLLAVVGFVTAILTSGPAFTSPVGYLMGHGMAEDNAKWLDFTSQWATGSPIQQNVPMGGPLQLALTGMGSAMALLSQAYLGGFNEVAVAANTVVLGQYLLAAMAPLALAPLVEARLRHPTARPTGGSSGIPTASIWAGAGVLAMALVLTTGYGHLTWQFTAVVATLWVAAFLVKSDVPRAWLLTSLTMACAMTVWVPLNFLAVVILVGVVCGLVARRSPAGWRGIDWVGTVLTLIVVLSIFEPIRSSLAFMSASSTSAMGSTGTGGRLTAAAHFAIPPLRAMWSGVGDTLFAAGGGTEQVTPVLGLIAATATLAAIIVVSRQNRARDDVQRVLPIVALSVYAVIIGLADHWLTGTGPNYGAMKFAFLVAIVLLTSCLPVGLMLLDPGSGRMTLPRWGAVLLLIVMLTTDNFLPRAMGGLRPQQWDPPPRFANNPKSSWWPAEVKRTGEQSIADNPIACVYLPNGAAAPSALTDLPDPQRAYSCTRVLAGLSGKDAQAQPLVDWLRREWLTNTPAWVDVYGYLADMPDSVKDKPIILMDKGSNVIGLESLASLLQRYPNVPQ